MAKIQSANKVTPKEMDALRKVYSPEQMAAVEAAQGAIDPVDMLSQWQRRDDTFQLDYMEDFATVKPSIDQKPRVRAPPSPHARWMRRNELMDDIWDWAKSKIPGLSETMSEGEIEDLVEKTEISDMDIERWWKERGVMTDNAEDVFLKGEDGESLGRPTAFTSALPDTVPGVSDLYATKAENEESADPRRLDPDGVYNDLRRKTGLTLAQLLSIKTKTIVTRRVVNQTRMGKIMSTASMAIAGNGNGWLGFGQFKSVDPIISAEQARLAALGNMMPIRRYENRTIYGNVEKKFGASIVQLYQRPPGECSVRECQCSSKHNSDPDSV
jgi:small subunit ribosomal protein S5